MRRYERRNVHRTLGQNRHHVRLRVDRILQSRRLQCVAVTPLTGREVGAKALLSRGLGVAESAEALVGILDSLESDDHLGSLVADSLQLRSDVLLELAVMGGIHSYIVSVRSLDAVRRERSSVGSEGAMVNGVTVLRCDNRGLLLSEEVDQLQNRGNDLSSILPVTGCV